MSLLKIEGVLILCIVIVLAKICFEKFAPKVRHLVHGHHNTTLKTRHISQTNRRIENKLTGSSFNVYLYFAKILVCCGSEMRQLNTHRNTLVTTAR